MGEPMNRKTCATHHSEPRPLRTQEIEQRIDLLIQELALSSAEAPSDTSARNPRWISAAELVRRMRPFIVLN